MTACTRRMSVWRGSVGVGSAVRAETFCDLGLCNGLDKVSGGACGFESFAGFSCDRVDLWALRGESSRGGLVRRADLEDGGKLKEDVEARFVVDDDGAESMVLENWC